MRIIGVCGRKGGVGKTTLAVHLAAELATRGNAVTLIDCDLQGSAAYWAEPGNLPMQVEHMPLENGGQVAEWSNTIRRLKAQYLVLDSPPHLDSALGGVLGLADLAVVPCGPSGLDLMATGEMVGLIREIRKSKGGRKPAILLVPNRVDRRTAAGKELVDALADLGEPVTPELCARTALSDAFNRGQWVGSYAPFSPAHLEVKKLCDSVLQRMEKGK